MKRPWNIIDLPVYSLLSNDINGNINMNICTYVSAVSMKPKIYSIAIDFKTKTYDNLIASDRVVLQLLSKKNISQNRGRQLLLDVCTHCFRSHFASATAFPSASLSPSSLA